MIKYHDAKINPQYGEDGKLLNNWDPDKDYKNEYVKVYFRIDAKGYNYPDFCFSDEDRAVFNSDVNDIFTKLGWVCKAPEINGACQTYINGRSNLYMHPQNFSGEVLKNDIKTIAEELENAKSFKLRWVDLYDTVYDITDAEYEEILTSKDEEIKSIVLEQCKTSRINRFYYLDQVTKSVADKVRVLRIGIDDGRTIGIGQTAAHIVKVIDRLVDKGYVIMMENQYGKLIRTINKTEQKQRKLFIA